MQLDEDSDSDFDGYMGSDLTRGSESELRVKGLYFLKDLYSRLFSVL